MPERVADIETSVPIAGLNAANWELATVPKTGMVPETDLRFIEANWDLGRIGDFSYDAQAGTLENMFDFSRPRAGKLFLDPATGQVLSADE